MSKVDFINQFESISDIEFTIEHGCKVTSENIITDKANIIFEKVDKRTLIDLASKMFDNKSKIIDFINNIYNQHEDEIHRIIFGYADGYKEIYFETRTDQHSELGISYDEVNDTINEYRLSDVSETFKQFLEDVYSKTAISLLPDNKPTIDFGYIKNNSYYFIIYKPLTDIMNTLSLYCKHINSNTSELDNWLQEHSSHTVTFISYKNENDKTTLNIYTKNKL